MVQPYQHTRPHVGFEAQVQRTIRLYSWMPRPNTTNLVQQVSTPDPACGILVGVTEDLQQQVPTPGSQ